MIESKNGTFRATSASDLLSEKAREADAEATQASRRGLDELAEEWAAKAASCRDAARRLITAGR